MASLREIRRAYEAGIRDGLGDIGQVVLDEGSRIIAAEAVDRGDLLASGEVMKPEARSVTVKWSTAHAKYVNNGTRPHWPPLAPILAWVKRNIRRYTTTKGEVVDVIKPSGKMNERARKSPERVALEVAHAIQAKIARDGTAPIFFAERATQKARPQAPGLIRAAVDARIQKLK